MPDLKYIEAIIEKAEDGEFVAIASTSREDRHGEVVSADGWDLKNFKANPLILWGHNHTEPAIGKATRVWLDKTGTNPILKFKAFISEATTRGREIKQLMAEGILKAFSVGFRPLDSEGNTFTKQELLEISVVNVPANTDAMMLAYKSLDAAGFKAKDMADIGIPADIIKELGSQREKINMLEGKVDLAVKGLQHLNPHTLGRKQILADQLTMAKILAKTADRLVVNKDPRRQRIHMAKIAKRTSEKLIVSLKGEYNGTNQRVKGKAS